MPLCISFQERRRTLKGVRENDLFGEQPDNRASVGSEEAVPFNFHTADGVAASSEKKVHFLSPFLFYCSAVGIPGIPPGGLEGDKSTPPDTVIIPQGSHNCKSFFIFFLRHFQQIGELKFFIFLCNFFLTFLWCGVL